jgi:ribonuclease P protein component
MRKQQSRIARSGRTGKPGTTLHASHFILHASFPSTKKQELRMAFGVPAGPSTARNRAKRQAREEFRLKRIRLPRSIDILITNKGPIGKLSRRRMREEFAKLLDQACVPPRPGRDGKGVPL